MGNPGALDSSRPRLEDDRWKLSGEKSSMPFYMCYVAAVAFSLMPHDLPRWFTAYSYFRRWKRDGTWERVHHALRRQLRVCVGRDPEPSAAVIDSQSVKTSPVRGDARDYDAGKKNLGPKTASAGGYTGLSDLRQSAGGQYHGS